MPDRLHRALVLLLLASGLVIRLWAVPHARFTGDESDYWYKSRQVAVGGLRPAYGPEITGSAAHLPGPAYYYLMAVPQALGPSPYIGSAFVAILHILTSFLLYRLVALARGPRAGLVALVLVAFAPWDILYGDRIWGSCVVPVWGCLALYAAARAKEQPAWLGALLFLAGVLPQLHLSVPVLWAACGILIWLRPPPRWPYRALLVGGLLALIAYLPYLVAEWQSGFSNTQKILAHSGGQAPWGDAWGAAGKVFLYAVFYGSSEAAYHWELGYWGGRFSELQAYLTSVGWQQWWTRHGLLLGLGHIVSVTLSAVGWGWGLSRAGQALISYLRTRRSWSLETALSLALVAGLGVGAVLLLAARKTYFPHYANILMPVLLAPVVFGLDAALERRRLRWVVGPALAISVTAMLVGTVRYYRQVDGLNGLSATMAMVGRVLNEPSAQVDFKFFRNGYAWQRIAQGVYGRSLPPNRPPPVTFTVHNDQPHRGEIPPGGSLHGAVLLRRHPPDSATASLSRVAYGSIRVEAEHPGGRTIPCQPADGLAGACRYGPQPWQRFEPTGMTVAGRPWTLLFMHPISGGVVRARMAVPSNATSATFFYAFSDAAAVSDNRSPVVLTVRAADRTLATETIHRRRGLRSVSFVTSSANGPLTVELRTDRDGEAILGFDVAWTLSPTDGSPSNE